MAACWGNSYKIEGLAEGFGEGDTLLLSDVYLSAKPFDTVIVSEGKFHYRGVVDSARLQRIYVMGCPDVQALFFAEPGKTVSICLNADGTSKIGGTEANDAWQQLTDMCNTYEQQVEALVSSFYQDEISEQEMTAVTDRIKKLDQQKAEWLDSFAEYNKDNATGTFLRKSIR